MKIREMSVRAEICTYQSNCCLEYSHNQAQISFSRMFGYGPLFKKKKKDHNMAQIEVWYLG